MEWILFEKGLIETGTTHCYWITAPVAGMVIFGILSLPVTKFEGGIVGVLSRISFEMFLVHSAMLNWTGAVSPSVLCYGVYFLVGTIALGQVLNWVATLVNRRLTW